jgi:predicted DNA binding CopG/RHH family protein
MKAMKVAKEWPSHLKTEREIAEFFDTHSTHEIWDTLKPARPFKMPPEQVKRIHERHQQRKAKAAISLRLEQEQIDKAKQIAASKSIGYQTQLRLWIAEGIQRESRKASVTRRA